MNSAATSSAPAAARHDHDRDYGDLLAAFKLSFDSIASTCTALFMTDAEFLYEAYLECLPGEKQVHTCNACRRFVQTYGAIVTIGEDGDTIPVMWDPEGVPEFYRAAFAELRRRVKQARVTSVFTTKAETWGTPQTGAWTHLSARPPASLLHKRRDIDEYQAMALSRHHRQTVTAALAEYTPDLLDQAIRLLASETLDRSQKFIAPVQWLRRLHDRPRDSRLASNILWRAIATAPESYCTPRSSVIGALLDDIRAGLPFEDIRRKHAAKLNPTVYQRAQVAPAAGNIKAAEALVEKMGIARSLERRFATYDDIEEFVWQPKAKPSRQAGTTAGVFAGVEARRPGRDHTGVQPVEIPAVTMTWAKFSATVLPTAEQLEIMVPSHGAFIGLTAAEHADAPRIMKWDNSICWYVDPKGSSSLRWSLQGNAWARVTGVTNLPTMWGSRPMAFLHEGAVLLIEGAKDTRNSAAMLFMECLINELSPARSTIEAFSKNGKLHEPETATACGYDLRKGGEGCTLRAWVGGAWSTYRIDRWD